MSHSQNTPGRHGLLDDDDLPDHPAARSEWEADTDVMPPEYGRQLLRISRQLERER